MRRHWGANSVIACCLGLCLYLSSIRAEGADLFYDVAIRGTYESNVVALLSDERGGTASTPSPMGPMMTSAAQMFPGMGPRMSGGVPQNLVSQSKSDTSLNLFADIGGSTQIASGTYAFLLASAQHTSYSTFTDLDSTIGGLSVGLTKRLGDVFSARIEMVGSIKRYSGSLRDGSAYGPAITLKEQIAPLFWLKQGYFYEKNNADEPSFSYTANSASIWGGYLVLPKLTVLVGYNYLKRSYEGSSDFQLTAQTGSVGLQYEFLERWFIDTQYDNQRSDSNVPGTGSTDNILSLGVRYSY
jgi:hypothetical protein